MNLAYGNQSLLENYKWDDSMCSNILSYNSVSSSSTSVCQLVKQLVYRIWFEFCLTLWFANARKSIAAVSECKQ
jgi:hypothetical protein